jgi:hypothetical protein
MWALEFLNPLICDPAIANGDAFNNIVSGTNDIAVTLNGLCTSGPGWDAASGNHRNDDPFIAGHNGDGVHSIGWKHRFAQCQRSDRQREYSCDLAAPWSPLQTSRSRQTSEPRQLLMKSVSASRTKM